MNPYPPNPQPELARERNRIAADRSLLSFVRNSVTLISTGVGVDQILRRLAPIDPNLDLWIYLISLVFIGLGVVNLLCAALDYQGEMKRLRQPEYYFTPRWSLGGMTGLILLIIGLIIFIKLSIEALIG
jgi:putative membrane protein